MSEKSNRSLTNPTPDPGFFQGLNKQLRLIMRLMADSRVNLWLKVLPVGALVYLISPFDFPTPIDDAVVIGVGFFTFVELCPDEVVAEHRTAIEAGSQKEEEEA
jgi:uncharacterized membrane protein YkvA (DUF1232 family)